MSRLAGVNNAAVVAELVRDVIIVYVDAFGIKFVVREWLFMRDLPAVLILNVFKF